MTAIAQALTTALFDFLWQGLLVASLLWMALFLLRRHSARARYAASCVALAGMFLLPAITACLVYRAAMVSQAPHASLAAMSPSAHAVQRAGGHSVMNAEWLAPWVLPVWSLGVLLFSLRMIWASRRISVVRRRSKPAEAAVMSVIAALRERMRLSRPVRVLVTAAADCPSVVGWVRPVVLLPAATVLGLTPQQLEAVLAHELAHILRYDHLINMLQGVVETLLFYHPAVWWASARMRHERELCCDDLAVESCGDALCYARALTRLERMRLTNPALALGSNGGSLMYRIQRLVGDACGSRGPSKLPGVLALTLGLVCFALNVQWARGQQQDGNSLDAAAVETFAPDEPGVRVDLGGAKLVHREPVEYPDAAIEKRVEGTVVLETALDADGAVSDARVLSGPPELRKAALESVLEWQFAPDAAGSTRQVTIEFQLPPGGAEDLAPVKAKRQRDKVEAAVQKQLAENLAKNVDERARELQTVESQKALVEALQQAQMAEKSQMLARVLPDHQGAVESAERLTEAQQAQMAALEKRLAELQARAGSYRLPGMLNGRRVKTVTIDGLSGAAHDELLGKLPVHAGDTLALDSLDKLEATVKQFDPHLNLSITISDGQVDIRISTPDK
ncbi:MAG: TonB family protein [Bryobacteraceae bacterium]